MSDSLRITEIFYSLQGESLTVGAPTVFVRLTGCPLRCSYCDSEYAFFGGERLELTEIEAKIATYSTRYVCITGGEPLAQPNVYPLMAKLCDIGYKVSLETSGAFSVADVDPRVHIVIDFKTPGSGEVEKNLWLNTDYLAPKDQIKFVITDRADYEWARFKIDEFSLTERAGAVLFSPSYEQLAPQLLAEWILQDQLSVRLQIQLHKSLWGDRPGV